MAGGDDFLDHLRAEIRSRFPDAPERSDQEMRSLMQQGVKDYIEGERMVLKAKVERHLMKEKGTTEGAEEIVRRLMFSMMIGQLKEPPEPDLL